MLTSHGLVNTVSLFNSNLRPELDALHRRHRKSMIDVFTKASLYLFTNIDGKASDTSVIWCDHGQFITVTRMEN
jgi:hypothetical protein